jgi:hypothetical protein
MGAKLVLGRDQLIPVILSEHLYQVCPEYAPVGELVDLSRPTWEKSYQESCCGGDPRILFAALDTFMAVTRQLLIMQPQAIDRLRGFLGAKFGSAATPTWIYYRKDTRGRPDRLMF